jgi:hypothetical protein
MGGIVFAALHADFLWFAGLGSLWVARRNANQAVRHRGEGRISALRDFAGWDSRNEDVAKRCAPRFGRRSSAELSIRPAAAAADTDLIFPPRDLSAWPTATHTHVLLPGDHYCS